MKRGRPRYQDVLTPREWEVLELIERGLTNEEIAERLGVSHATAKFHVSEILSKLNLPNRREAGAWRLRRVPAVLSLLKGGAFLAGTAAVATIIYFVLFPLLQQDSPSGATHMGKVAYVKDGDVWVKELPSGPEKQITDWGDVTGEPQWSASGEWLSLTRNTPRPQPTPPPGLLPGPAGIDTSTWIIDADGKRERQVGDQYVIPTWSPVNDEYLIGATIEAADGSNRRVLLAANNTVIAGLFSGAWTPSGEWIIAHVTLRSTPDTPPTRALARVRPDGTDAGEFYRVELSECQKKTWIAKAGSCHPEPTAEGDERIPAGMAGVLTDTHVIGIFQALDDANQLLPATLRTIPFVAANEVLTGGNVSFGHEFTVYSPASGRLASLVVSNPAPDATVESRLALAEPATGTIEFVTAPEEAATYPAWSPDGRTLFFAAADGSTDAQAAGAGDAAIDGRRIWSVDSDGSNRTQLTHDPRYRDEYPQATPDGTSVLFTRIDLESEGNPASLWLLDPATGELTMVVDDFDQPQQLATAWPRLLDWWQPQ